MEARMSAVETFAKSMDDKTYALEERLDQLQAQLIQQITNQNLAEAAHQQVHSEIAELRKLAAEVERMKSHHGSNPNSPDKSLIPEVYFLEKAKWSSWSLRFKRYQNRKHPGVRALLEKVERMMTPLSREYLEAVNLDSYINDDIMDLLTAKTDGEAGVIVRTAQNESVLEVWRRIGPRWQPSVTSAT